MKNLVLGKFRRCCGGWRIYTMIGEARRRRGREDRSGVSGDLFGGWQVRRMEDLRRLGRKGNLEKGSFGFLTGSPLMLVKKCKKRSQFFSNHF